MAFLIGVDEAGYGPNLGPLAVAATAWRVSDEAPSDGRASAAHNGGQRSPSSSGRAGGASATLFETSRLNDFIDLYDRLSDVVTREPTGRDDSARLAIADSKLLYKPGGGLRLLERAVLTALRCCWAGSPLTRPLLEEERSKKGTTWRCLVADVGADPDGRIDGLPWHDGFDCRLPIDAAVEEIAPLAAALGYCCNGAGVQLVAIRARLVFPEEFNALVARFNTKGAALSHVTLALVRRLVDEVCPGESEERPIWITLDKHGGRNRYAGLIQHHFPESWIEPILESRAASRYHWTHGRRRIDACFRTGGEAELPAALASMTAKYCRELAMRAFNQFWLSRVPGIRPTAGYPVDAKRFKAEIAAAQTSLGIGDAVLWRCR